MKETLSLDLSKTNSYLKEHKISYFQPVVSVAHKMLLNKAGVVNDFWVDRPSIKL